MYSGIDVSKHNGTLDWESIKDCGIKFAIIRIGFGNDDRRQDDTQAVRNMNECERLGIPYGVYLFSYAVDEYDAASEAAHALRMVEEHYPALGIWYDMEDAPGYRNSKYMNVSGRELSKFCKIFCDKMISNNYRTGIYANKYYFDEVLDPEVIGDYQKWLAHWDIDEPDIDCIMWQYSSQGKIWGSSENTDLDYYYGEL